MKPFFLATNSFTCLLLLVVIAFLSCTSNGRIGINTGKEQGLASKYPGDKNIEQNPDVIFASGFENGFQGWTSFNEKVSKIISNATEANGGSQFLQTTATRGKNTGGDVVVKFPGVDAVYLRFYTKFEENSAMPHHFVKIRAFYPQPYWGNAGKKPLGHEAFWTGIEPLADNTWNFYTYWHEMHSWQSPDGTVNPARGDNPYYGNVFKPDNQKPFKRG